jgi:hypothetical protein
MEIGLDHWRDGTGYDLAALGEATPEERQQIESLLLARGIRDWRDVQALAALATPAASQLLAASLGGSNAAIEMAVLRYAPEVVPADARTASVVSALNSAKLYEGLTQALLEVEEFHPPPVIDALLRGVLQRDGATAGEFAAMLLFLHGQAESPLAWEHRDLRLRLLDGERHALFREFCALIGVAPEPYLSTVPAAR